MCDRRYSFVTSVYRPRPLTSAACDTSTHITNSPVSVDGLSPRSFQRLVAMADLHLAEGTNRFMHCASARSAHPHSIINMHTDKHTLKLKQGTNLMRAIAAEDTDTIAAICKTGTCGLFFFVGSVLCFALVGRGALSRIALTGNVCCSICTLVKIGIALNDSWLSNDPAYAGILPLFLASQKDSFAIVQLLLEHDASPNLLSHNSSETCLLVRDRRTASTSLCVRSVHLLQIH